MDLLVFVSSQLASIAINSDYCVPHVTKQLSLPKEVPAITVHQPAASWIAQGYKRIEVRTQYTEYRGPLLINASKTKHGDHPTGCTLCIVDLVDVRPMSAEEEEDAMCIWSDDREYAWVFERPRPIKAYSVEGRRGLYYWTVPRSMRANPPQPIRRPSKRIPWRVEQNGTSQKPTIKKEAKTSSKTRSTMAKPNTPNEEQPMLDGGSGSPKKARKRSAASSDGTRSSTGASRKIEQYEHTDKKRVNNPPVGLVSPETDVDGAKKVYQYDPHLDPQLVWAGKAEHTSFDVPTVSLHVHERIDPRTIIDAVRNKKSVDDGDQLSFFGQAEQNPPLREAIDFYKHDHGWSNRLIAGDSLLVMNSLLEKEGMAGKVQMVYIDPPYGIKYGSNFQPFVNKRDVKDGKDEDLTQEPEMIRAFRDTWELGLHSYLSYFRNRLLLAHDLLHESGSVFVQISDENVHHLRELLDEVMGASNFVSQIAIKKTVGLGSSGMTGTLDYVLWYARNRPTHKFHALFQDRRVGRGTGYAWIELRDGSCRRMTAAELDDPDVIPTGARVFCAAPLMSSGYTESCTFDFEFEGRIVPAAKYSWKTTYDGVRRLIEHGRIIRPAKLPNYKLFAEDYPVEPISNYWGDVRASDVIYVVQTSNKVIQRCMLMTTDPGDLVVDPTCGSGTTAYVAEQWGRRWITCDSSRVAVVLAKQRLMTASFDYYQLARPDEGIGSGFRYRTVPHVTLKSLANSEPPKPETLHDQPFTDSSKSRVTGPFTVEAVPAPTVLALHSVSDDADTTATAMAVSRADIAVARTGETLRQSEWRDELLKTGIRGKDANRMMFSHIEPLPGTQWLHAEGETIASETQPVQRVVFAFGHEHAPLEQRQVARALEEAQSLIPKPKSVVFVSFRFDPEAAKDISETSWPGVTLLMAEMSMDLQTEDLKKKRSSSESFWFIGQPDVALRRIGDGEHKGKYEVEVIGFDYFDIKSGTIKSGTASNIAMWLLDTDYDGRSLFPRQVYFPMSGDDEGWSRLAKNLGTEIDEELIEQYRGTVSLPFEPGKNKRVAVKLIDDRGVESLKLIEVK